MRGTIHRLRISTTVAPETHQYLAGRVESGRATSMAKALDQAVLRARSTDSMERSDIGSLDAFSFAGRALAGLAGERRGDFEAAA